MSFKNRKAAFLITAFSIMLFCTCSGTTTDELLEGSFVEIDRSTPATVSPVNDKKVTGLKATLVWSKIYNAKEYTVEISLNEDFSKNIPGSPFTVEDTYLDVTFPDAYTYYWRVRADMTEAGKYSPVRKIHVFNDALYVHCPGADTECSNRYTDEDGNEVFRSGNKSDPFREISPALVEAKSLDLEVHVAAREGGKAYNESISLVEGVNLLGGYSPEDWSRNTGAHVTKITSSTDKAVYGGFMEGDTAFSLDGFTITSTGTDDNAYGLFLEEVNSSLTVSNNAITGGNGSENYGVYMDKSGASIEKNEILGGSNGTNYGIYLAQESDPSIEENTITGCSAGTTCYGVYTDNSGGTIESNTVYGDDDSSAVSQTWGIYYINNASTGVKNNTIYGGHGASSSCGIEGAVVNTTISGNRIYGQGKSGGTKSLGIEIHGTSAVTLIEELVVINNLIHGGASDISRAVHVQNASSSTFIRNNTIFTDHSSSDIIINIAQNATPVIQNNMLYAANDGRCIREEYSTGDPELLQNNNFLECNILYTNENTTDISLITDVNNLGDSSGNTAIDNTGSQLFINAPVSTEYTEDGDGAGGYEGSTNYFEVAENVCGDFIVGQYIEYNNDGVLREITAKDCDPTKASDIVFSPVLSSSTVAGKPVRLWGSASSAEFDLRPAVPSAGNCNTLYGGLDLSSYFTKDIEGTIRTTGYSGCTPSNSGAAGWTMGAYEKDE